MLLSTVHSLTTSETNQFEKNISHVKPYKNVKSVLFASQNAVTAFCTQKINGQLNR